MQQVAHWLENKWPSRSRTVLRRVWGFWLSDLLEDAWRRNGRARCSRAKAIITGLAVADAVGSSKQRNSMANSPTAHMAAFVWSEISSSLGEKPEHLVVRKEAERVAGSGEFWWCVDAPLGIGVEIQTERRGTLPILFSKSRSNPTHPGGQIRVWDAWRSLLHPHQYGRIPSHVIVISSHHSGRRQTRYALICHSSIELTRAPVGFCDLAQCKSLKGRDRVVALRGAHLLIKGKPLLSVRGPASQNVYSIAFEATLVGHSLVVLEKCRVLTERELSGLMEYKAGDDWLTLAKMLRGMGADVGTA